MKKSYIKNLILPAVLIAAIFSNVFASTDYEVITGAGDNFNRANGAITDGVTKADAYGFSAEVKDNALVMKSDSLWYWRADNSAYSTSKDGNDLNKAENAKGIKVYTVLNDFSLVSDVCEADAGGYYYTSGSENIYTNANYIHAGASGNTILPTNAGGLDALGVIYYHRQSTKADRANDTAFIVDENVIEELGANPIVKVKWYAVADTEDENAAATDVSASILYRTNDSITYNTPLVDGLPEGTSFQLNTWLESTISTNIDWRNYNGGHFWFSNQTGGKTGVYIHSVELQAANAPDPMPQNSYTKELYSSPIRKNTRVEFDMTLPSDESVVSSCSQAEATSTTVCGAVYNADSSSMYVSLLNGEKTEGAKIKLDLADDGTFDVYDETGTTLIAEDLSVGTKYTYSLTLDLDENQLVVEIKEGDTVEGSETFVTGFDCHTQYIKFTYDAVGGVMAVVDDIKVFGKDNPKYLQCVEDAENLTAISQGDVMAEDFELPLFATNSTIDWSVKSGGSYLSIDGNLAELSRDVEDRDVTLTATFTHNEDSNVVYEYDITIVVKGVEGLKVESDVEASISAGNVVATAEVKYPKTTGAQSVTFAVFAIGEDGEITSRASDTQTTTSDYDVLNFNLNFDAAGGTAVKYYLWDENDKPIVNNKPVVSEVSAASVARGAALTWNGYDDFDAIGAYEIYRDGVKIDTVSADVVEAEAVSSNLSGINAKYVDETAEIGVEYEYAVLPIDSNDVKGDKVEKDEDGNSYKAKKVPFTYYIVLDGANESTINSSAKGINIRMGADTQENYTLDGASNGANRPSRYINNSGRKHFLNLVTTEFIGDKYKTPVAVRFTIYALSEFTVETHYNQQGPGGTDATDTNHFYWNGPTLDIDSSKVGKWIEFDVTFEDPAFGTSQAAGKFSNGHFGLSTTAGETERGIFVSKVEMIELEKYDLVGE